MSEEVAPLPAHARYRCRGCNFNLTGLTLTAGRLTCPECGRTGSLLEVAEPQPPPAPPIYKTLWLMGRWSTGLLIFTMVLALLVPLTGLGVFAQFAFLPGVAALVAGLGSPLLVAGEVASVHYREQRRFAESISLAIAGVAVNILQCVLAIVLMAILSDL